MSRKLDNDQLRQTYFKNHTSLRSFAEQQTPSESKRPSSPQNRNDIGYARLDQKQISRFEDIFNTFVDPLPKKQQATPEPVFEEPTPPESATSRSYREFANTRLYEDFINDRIQKAEIHKPAPQSQLEMNLISEMHAHQKMLTDMQTQVDFAQSLSQLSPIQQKTPSPVYNLQQIDEDLMYLDNLVSGNGYRTSTNPANSIDDLLAEIVGNEKSSVSNYEPSVFDANIEELFNAGADIERAPMPTPTPAPIPTPVPIMPQVAQATIPTTEPTIPSITPIPTTQSPIPEINPTPTISTATLPITPPEPTATIVAPTAETTSNLTPPSFELPPLPDLNFLTNAPKVLDKKVSDDGAKKKNSERSKQLKIIDLLIALVVITIVGILAFYFLQLALTR